MTEKLVNREGLLLTTGSYPAAQHVSTCDRCALDSRSPMTESEVEACLEAGEETVAGDNPSDSRSSWIVSCRSLRRVRSLRTVSGAKLGAFRLNLTAADCLHRKMQVRHVHY
jgi:hypothetical protein